MTSMWVGGMLGLLAMSVGRRMEEEATLTSPCLDDSSKQPLSASQSFFIRKSGRLGKLGIQGFNSIVYVFKYHKDPQGMLAARGKMQLSGPDNEGESGQSRMRRSSHSDFFWILWNFRVSRIFTNETPLKGVSPWCFGAILTP